MLDRDSPRPPFAVRLRIFVSEVFDHHARKDIGWYRFFNGLDAEMAQTPLELARKAFIDMSLSPEVDPDHNSYAREIAECIIAYLANEYGWTASKDQMGELAKRWRRHKYGKETTAPIRAWFDEVYGAREPRLG